MDNLSFDEFLEKIVERTETFYRDDFKSSPKKIEIFKNNLEDLLLFNIVTIHDTRIIGTGKCDKNGSVSKDIITALESVGITRNNINGLYEDSVFKVDRISISKVKRRIIDNETKYLKSNIVDYIDRFFTYDDISTSDFLDYCFCISDRMSGYYEETDPITSMYLLKLQYDVWDTKKKEMDLDSFSFKVLTNVIEGDFLHHYSLIERSALKKMCNVMDKIEEQGLSSISSGELYNVNKSIKLAMMVNKDKMEEFSKLYNTALEKASIRGKIESNRTLKLVK